MICRNGEFLAEALDPPPTDSTYGWETRNVISNMLLEYGQWTKCAAPNKYPHVHLSRLIGRQVFLCARRMSL